MARPPSKPKTPLRAHLNFWRWSSSCLPVVSAHFTVRVKLTKVLTKWRYENGSKLHSHHPHQNRLSQDLLIQIQTPHPNARRLFQLLLTPLHSKPARLLVALHKQVAAQHVVQTLHHQLFHQCILGVKTPIRWNGTNIWAAFLVERNVHLWVTGVMWDTGWSTVWWQMQLSVSLVGNFLQYVPVLLSGTTAGLSSAKILCHCCASFMSGKHGGVQKLLQEKLCFSKHNGKWITELAALDLMQQSWNISWI